MLAASRSSPTSIGLLLLLNPDVPLLHTRLPSSATSSRRLPSALTTSPRSSAAARPCRARTRAPVAPSAAGGRAARRGLWNRLSLLTLRSLSGGGWRRRNVCGGGARGCVRCLSLGGAGRGLTAGCGSSPGPAGCWVVGMVSMRLRLHCLRPPQPLPPLTTSLALLTPSALPPQPAARRSGGAGALVLPRLPLPRPRPPPLPVCRLLRLVPLRVCRHARRGRLGGCLGVLWGGWAGRRQARRKLDCG